MDILKKIMIFVFIATFYNCKKDGKEVSEDAAISDIKTEYQDKTFEDALYGGLFLKADDKNPFDILLSGKSVYFIKPKATEQQKNTQFFFHIIPTDKEFLNMDFKGENFLYNEQLSSAYDSIYIIKRDLPEGLINYDISTGQFNASGRVWSKYIQINKLKPNDSQYKNQYFIYNKVNRFEEDFENALDYGFFIKHQNGFDLLLGEEYLYFIKQYASQEDKENIFFLHIALEGESKSKNMDFNYKDFAIDDFLSEKFSDLTVARRKMPSDVNLAGISTGQLDKSRVRTWSVFYPMEKIYNKVSFVYDNQYGTDKNKVE